MQSDPIACVLRAKSIAGDCSAESFSYVADILEGVSSCNLLLDDPPSRNSSANLRHIQYILQQYSHGPRILVSVKGSGAEFL